MKADLVITEKHILKELAFNVHVQHPHKLVINYLKILNQIENLGQKAWNYMNDRFLFLSFLLFLLLLLLLLLLLCTYLL